MTRDRLAKLIKHPSTSDQEAISALEEIVARFPYYTNGHILLTMQYRLLDHIRYDSQLRRTSVYVPDRAVLRRLVLAEDDISLQISTQDSEEPLAKVEAVEGISAANNDKKVSAIEAIDEIEKAEPQTADAKLDPREVIEQRLRELKQQEQLVRDQLIENTNLETPIIVPIKGEVTKDADVVKPEPTPTPTPTSTSNKESSQELIDQIEAKEVEPAVQIPKLNEEVSKPVEKQQLIDKPKEINEPRSFSDWLKVLPTQDSKTINNDSSKIVTKIETAGDYFGIDSAPASDSNVKSKQEESIIDKFIREEPRIVPSKSEFYSPGNMARKSAQEHEDLISETLARIYAQQGNIAKAISTYERLALKLPQKKAYFASLIDDLLSRS